MQCTVDAECPAPSLYTFVWPWGTEGACCQTHVGIVQQKAVATRGEFATVSFTRLDPDRPKVLSRDERIELLTLRMVAESERDEARKRAAELFEVNTKLAGEVRVHKLRADQLQAQTAELLARVDVLLRERDEALTLAAKTREELEADMMQQVEVLVNERTNSLQARLQLSEEGRQTLMREEERLRRELSREMNATAEANVKVAELENELRERAQQVDTNPEPSGR